MKTAEDLTAALRRIDGRGYKAYQDIAGGYDFGSLALFIDRVQGDPFAAPSKVRVRVWQSAADLPIHLHCSKVRRIALQDYLARRVRKRIGEVGRSSRGSGKSVLITIDAGGQQVIERTSLVVNSEWVEARLQVGLPAAGRRILGNQAIELLTRDLVGAVRDAFVWTSVPEGEATVFVQTIENNAHLRSALGNSDLVAFVADGSVLPRSSGASDRPLSGDGVVPFRTPDSMRAEFALPNAILGPDGERTDRIVGMGIPSGVTLIVGGGYHGKSTLLRALERGVYPHVPGDGREYVVTTADAVKIRAEDGRRVEGVDISPFIGELPYGRSKREFCTDDASGSTSQAANILEAVEVGARLLLLDEDTSATNFMIRDARMQELVAKQHEPITPFLDRVRQLRERHGVSTILVMGGSGDYFDVADRVVMMRDYLPHDVTETAKRIAAERPSQRRPEAGSTEGIGRPRIPLAESFDASRGRRPVKIDAKAVDLIRFGTDDIDLRGVEQLVDLSQTRAVGYAIHMLAREFMAGTATLAEVVEAAERFFDEGGLERLDPFCRGEQHPGNFARPRKYEIAAAINRLRTVRMRQDTEA